MVNQTDEFNISTETHSKLISILGLAAIFLIGVILFNPVVQVPAGYRGVLTEFGSAKATLGEGLSFRIPVMQGVALMSVQNQRFDAKAGAASKDLQVVDTELTVNFVLSPESIMDTYRNLGENYADRVIYPSVQEVVKASTAKFTAEEIITKRESVKADIEQGLRDKLSQYNIKLLMVSITNFDFSADFNKAIENKVTAEQNALQAQNVLKQITIEAEQKVAAARGEAEALKLVNEQLSTSTLALQARWLDKWDGHLPQVISGDASSLMIMPVLNNTG